MVSPSEHYYTRTIVYLVCGAPLFEVRMRAEIETPRGTCMNVVPAECANKHLAT